MKQYSLILPLFFFFIPTILPMGLTIVPTALGSDRLETGEKIFTSYCNVCHIGGNNIILPEKNLQKRSLEANGMNNMEAIMYQVTNGKNGMPAFGGRLKETEIESVAIYIPKEFGTGTE